MNFLLDRRRLLIGLAAASTAAAAPVVAGAVPVLESPQLLRLADLLPGVLAERQAARDHKQAVINDWWWEWPLAPAAICDGHAYGYNRDCEHGLTGSPILASGEAVPTEKRDYSWEAIQERKANPDAHYSRLVLSAKFLTSKRDDCLRAIRRKRPKHQLSGAEIAELETLAADYSEKAALAAVYETERERVRAASGYGEAVARCEAAFDAMSKLIGEIVATPATTMAGVIIKAQALAAWEADPQAISNISSWSWPGAFASEVLAIASA